MSAGRWMGWRRIRGSDTVMDNAKVGKLHWCPNGVGGWADDPNGPGDSRAAGRAACGVRVPSNNAVWMWEYEGRPHPTNSGRCSRCERIQADKEG